jgi:hypothetical protein
MKYIILISIIGIILLYYLSYNNITKCIEYFENSKIENLLEKSNRKFPYRYFKDENNNTLPIVALTAFFRSNEDKQLYYEYINNGINVIGVTAYKTFPLKIRDLSEDKYHLNDDFDYTKNIKIWLACMKNLDLHNITPDRNVTIDISESDFYDIDNTSNIEKLYDFIYICNKDSDSCPINGWNAINRNYALALKCFPIMFDDYNLKGLIVGRIGCDLDKYKNNLKITDFLPWHELQTKMHQTKFLFLPNIYDASPRVIAECLIKGLPILMNKNIVCGFKYINYYTGEFFIDEHDIKNGLDNILYKINNNLFAPKKWWNDNYGVEKTSIKLRNFLYTYFPDILKDVNNVSFII